MKEYFLFEYSVVYDIIAGITVSDVRSTNVLEVAVETEKDEDVPDSKLLVEAYKKASEKIYKHYQKEGCYDLLSIDEIKFMQCYSKSRFKNGRTI